MAADTGVNVEGFRVEIEGDKCCSHGDLAPMSVGGDCNVDGKDDYVFVNGNDVVSDDRGEVDVNGKVNASESISDLSETRSCDLVAGDRELNVSELNVDDEINGDQKSEIVNADCDESNNEVKVDVMDLKSENGVTVEAESESTVQDVSLVKENGEIMSRSEVLVEDEQSRIENGGSTHFEGEVVEVNCSKPLANGFSHGESCIPNGDNCNSIVDGVATRVSNGDKSGNLLESDATLSDTNEVQAEIPCGHTDQRNVLETPEFEAGETQVAEDNVESHVADDLVRDMELLDSNVDESKLVEADVEHQPEQGGVLEMQPSDNDSESAPLLESSEPQASDVEVKASLVDDAITVNQPSDYQQPEFKSVDGKREELGVIETQGKIMEQGELEPPEAIGNQELSSINSEVVESSDVKGETVMSSTAESEEVQELHTDLSQPEGADNENGVPSDSPDVERVVSDGVGNAEISKSELSAEVDPSLGNSVRGLQSDTTDNPSVDCDTERVDVNGTSELVAEEVGNRESQVEDDTIMDQVAEDSGSVDVQDKEMVLEDVGSERSMEVEEKTSQSKMQAVNDTATDNLGVPTNDQCKVEASENKEFADVIHSQTVSDSGEGSDAADGGLSTPVDNATGLSVPSDLDSTKEELGDTSLCPVHDSVVISVDDTSSHNNVESGNSTLPVHVPDANLQITAASDVDVVNELNSISNNILKPKISFGSFECEAPFSHADVNARPEVLNRSVELASSECKVQPNDDVASVTSEANGVYLTEFDDDKSSEDLSVEHVDKDKVSALPVKESGADVINEQNLNTESGRRPFHYLIRIPRYDDENLREQIRLHDLEVRERTQRRDTVRVEYQKTKNIIIELKSGLQAAKSEERAARDLVIAKKREIDSALSLINLARNAVTVEDVESRILNMERKIQHETLNLNEEKQLVREIKQMNHLKGQLHANSRGQEKLQQALDQRGQVEEDLKVLRKEMDALRDKLSKAEQSVQFAKKKYDEKSLVLNELYNKFKSADSVRQKAYEDLLTLKKQLSEKNKYFWNYKDDAKAANDLAVAGDKDSLEQHCVNQVEKIMELWNKDDEFRKEYIRCNKRSTLRRFRTLDGRSLGPNEEPPSIPIVYNGRETSLVKVNSVATVSTTEIVVPREAKEVEDNSSKKVVEQRNKTTLDKKTAKAASKNSAAEASGRTEIIEEEKEIEIEQVKLTKEEIELARRAEQLRREEEAARLREQRRLEEKAKAMEALERKKRMAEKAQARAEFRARKEAEQKEKEREKRSKKKEKKRGSASEMAESEPVVLAEPASEITREPEVTEKPVTVAKKHAKPLPYTKQLKATKSVPPPVRNKGKKKIKQWMCVIVPVMIVLALFYLGDSNFFRNWSFIFGSSY